jgi:sigma-B regulation protein RsbU (phosphoserine phosphatase)
MMKHWIDSRPVTSPDDCGDFVECHTLGPQRYAIAVGDIAGRGPAAARSAALLRAHVHNIMVRHAPLPDAMRSACAFFTGLLMSEATPFASLFMAVADLTDGWIEYCSAGHEPGLLFDDRGRHEHLNPTGPVLGLEVPSHFDGVTVAIHGHALLVIVTDGITEARPRGDGECTFFGSAGVVRALHGALRERQDPAFAIGTAAARHAQGHVTDDATVLVSSLSAAAALLPRAAVARVV